MMVHAVYQNNAPRGKMLLPLDLADLFPMAGTRVPLACCAIDTQENP